MVGSVKSGSSPLSRGILHRQGLRRHPARIIPALAGNTKFTKPAPAASSDHPRSRGEYAGQQNGCLEVHGSSPLSRGIQTAGEPPPWPPRIIPALAGNTCAAGLRAAKAADHPRSRGEYRPVVRRRPPPQGSSPLSRGILLDPLIPWRVIGIIPALAGNTPAATPRPRTCRDHPRSRGEYTC